MSRDIELTRRAEVLHDAMRTTLPESRVSLFVPFAGLSYAEQDALRTIAGEMDKTHLDLLAEGGQT